jgi:hypothetical protein
MHPVVVVYLIIGRIPCLSRLLRRVEQAEDTVVTADAEGGSVPAGAAHGVHPR